MQKYRGAGNRTDVTAPAKPAARTMSGAKRDEPPDQFIGAVARGASGNYTIQEAIGQGGMGAIYSALDSRGQRCAVKFILPMYLGAVSGKETAVARFLREASAAASINHPNVVHVFDVGTYRDTVFMAMEYLPGKDLKDLKDDGNRFRWATLAPLLMQACEGLGAAHDLGLMHRDLSPDNIRVTKIEGKEVVKIMDFGLAKPWENQGQDLTRTGNLVGKLGYMAPEQVDAANGKPVDVDYRVDIYALGVVMYRLMTGEPPFKAENDLLALTMRTYADPPAPSGINPKITPDVEDIILKAMARNPDDRYQDAIELRDDIARSLAALGRTPGSGTEAAFLGMLVDEEGSGSGAVRPSGPRPLQLGDMRMAPEWDDAGPERQLPQRKGGFGGFLKVVAAMAVLGGVAFGAYTKRHEIAALAGKAKTEYMERMAAAPSAKEEPQPEPSASPVQYEGFMARIESSPPSAYVYDITDGGKEYLGTTPLTRRFTEGEERKLLVVRRGYGQKKVTVSEAAPSQSVRLTRAARKVRTPEPEEIPEEELPPEMPGSEDPM